MLKSQVAQPACPRILLARMRVRWPPDPRWPFAPASREGPGNERKCPLSATVMPQGTPPAPAPAASRHVGHAMPRINCLFNRDGRHVPLRTSLAHILRPFVKKVDGCVIPVACRSRFGPFGADRDRPCWRSPVGTYRIVREMPLLRLNLP
mgnify:CR=1 FL=1